mmetsp:Transcript_1283/g.3614  ORF Transcript_1283/g.3614 Transcript_1283/m.3614 type:complete len:282 (-) Transcript_1283:306-1151(-)
MPTGIEARSTASCGGCLRTWMHSSRRSREERRQGAIASRMQRSEPSAAESSDAASATTASAAPHSHIRLHARLPAQGPACRLPLMPPPHPIASAHTLTQLSGPECGAGTRTLRKLTIASPPKLTTKPATSSSASRSSYVGVRAQADLARTLLRNLALVLHWTQAARTRQRRRLGRASRRSRCPTQPGGAAMITTSYCVLACKAKRRSTALRAYQLRMCMRPLPCSHTGTWTAMAYSAQRSLHSLSTRWRSTRAEVWTRTPCNACSRWWIVTAMGRWISTSS